MRCNRSNVLKSLATALTGGPYPGLQTKASACVRSASIVPSGAARPLAVGALNAERWMHARRDILEEQRTFTAEDVDTFLQLTGDANPVHRQDSPSGGRPILPGLLYAALFPAIIGSRCPGALYLSQSLKFRAQALVDEPLLARVLVNRVSGRRIMFETECFQLGSGAVIVNGEAVAMLHVQAQSAHR